MRWVSPAKHVLDNKAGIIAMTLVTPLQHNPKQSSMRAGFVRKFKFLGQDG